MLDTNFVNATGWPHEEHYTSAKDMATLTQELIKDFPEHYKMYSEKGFTYNDISQRNRKLDEKAELDNMKKDIDEIKSLLQQLVNHKA